MKRVIVAGSRDFNNYELVKSILDQEILSTNEVALISGTAKGADQMGERYAEERGIPLLRCPADWKRYGRAAGPRRNEEMVKWASLGDEQGILFAFWDGESRGTNHIIRYAEKNGLKVHIHLYK